MTVDTPYIKLKSAIKVLENERAVKEQLLRDEFRITYEKLNPFNFIKNTFSSFTESSEIRNGLFSILLPLATMFISKKAFTGNRGSNLFKQSGVLILNALNSYITQNPETINSISHYILNLFRKKKSPDQHGG